MCISLSLSVYLLYIYICIYVYIHTHIHLHIRMHIRTSPSSPLGTRQSRRYTGPTRSARAIQQSLLHLSLSLSLYLSLSIYIHRDICMYIYIYIYIHINVHRDVCVYLSLCNIYIYIYTCTSTQSNYRSATLPSVLMISIRNISNRGAQIPEPLLMFTSKRPLGVQTFPGSGPSFPDRAFETGRSKGCGYGRAIIWYSYAAIKNLIAVLYVIV